MWCYRPGTEILLSKLFIAFWLIDCFLIDWLISYSYLVSGPKSSWSRVISCFYNRLVAYVDINEQHLLLEIPSLVGWIIVSDWPSRIINLFDFPNFFSKYYIFFTNLTSDLKLQESRCTMWAPTSTGLSKISWFSAEISQGWQLIINFF